MCCYTMRGSVVSMSNEMVSLGDTVSTYLNRHGGGRVFCVSSDLNSGKKVRVFHWGGGCSV